MNFFHSIKYVHPAYVTTGIFLLTRKILSCVIASYFFSFVFVSFGISLLFSSSIRHGKYRFFDENTGLSQHSSSVVSPEVFTFFKQTMKPPVVQGMKVQNRTKLGGMRGAGFRG